ncbi:NUDIX domain-containing protein [Pseudomonas sp. LF19]|uniref:NUDIX domain-containing protein n=1 Tax=Pseudomonas sp. LF19 TaxID=2899115 RepID=UPI000FB86072
MTFYLKERLSSKLKSIINTPSVGVRAAIINKQHQILLIKHTYREGWHMPGGGLAPGETPIQGISREVKEETNLHIESAAVVSVLLNKWRSQHDYVILFKVIQFTGSPCINDPSEILDIEWFNTNQLPEDITINTRRRIEEIISGEPNNGHW